MCRYLSATFSLGGDAMCDKWLALFRHTTHHIIHIPPGYTPPWILSLIVHITQKLSLTPAIIYHFVFTYGRPSCLFTTPLNKLAWHGTLVSRLDTPESDCHVASQHIHFPYCSEIISVCHTSRREKEEEEAEVCQLLQVQNICYIS